MSEAPRADLREASRSGDGMVSFPGVRGHQEVQGMLARALARGQLHHALMLVGPRGIGKATLARGVAAALLCPEVPGVGCGRCVTCRRIEAGSHPDVDWLTPSGSGGQITIESARECHLRQANGPYESAAYLVIVDPADALNESSGNALLKAIEEPRPGIHFILLTTNMQGVLPTILSRTLPIPLGRLEDGDVAAILDAQAAEVGAERRQMATLLAEGSAGVALELAMDPVLDRCLDFVCAAIRAVAAGPPGIFGGDKGPLWTSYNAAVGEIIAIDQAAEAAEREAEAARSGRPARAGRAKKAAAKVVKGKASAAQQRWIAGRLAELWTLHLREQLRGRRGLPGATGEVASPPVIVRQIAILQRLAQRLPRNPSVRLILEQTLLELSATRV